MLPPRVAAPTTGQVNVHTSHFISLAPSYHHPPNSGSQINLNTPDIRDIWEEDWAVMCIAGILAAHPWPPVITRQ